MLKFLSVLSISMGVFMSQAQALALPDFDLLWNYGKPAETEAKFREVLPQAQSSGDKDYHLQLLTQIARTQVLQRKFDDALQTLNDVQASLGPQTPKAEVRFFLERGRYFNSSKKADEALPLFLKAFELASERGFENWAVDAAHMVAIAEPLTEKKLEWNLRALALAESATEEKARNWVGSLYNNIGWTYHAAGKFEQALELFRKALAFRESKGEAGNIRVARWCVARALRSLARLDEALAIQTALDKELARIAEKDGFVFEELGELYLATANAGLSKKYFAMAYEELSKDEWFKANEAPRLQRIKELGGL